MKLPLMKNRKFVFLAIICIVSSYYLIKSIAREMSHPEQLIAEDHIRLILDRDGRLLRELKPNVRPHGGFSALSEISPLAIKATLFVEDRHFFVHPGFNPISIVRSLVQNLKSGRIVSGGSTLTQQLARMLLKRRSRSYVQKMRELIYALSLEFLYTKDEILAMYLSVAPYGNQLFGIESAAQHYFKKSAHDLNLSEAFFLAGLVRAPTLYNPYLYPERANRRYESILRSYAQLGVEQRALVSHLKEPIVHPVESTYKAPHFVDYVLNHDELTWQEHKLTTSLDLVIQEQVEKLLKSELNHLSDKGVSQAAVLVLDTQTSEILAWVGSKDFWDIKQQGQFNGVLAHRQPGSALKPITYALAFANGELPNNLVADIAAEFKTDRGNYQPQNYDRQFHGPVRLRLALGSSLNIPAVRLLEKIGVVRLYSLLKNFGFEHLDQAANYYGLGLTLGNAEVSLLELSPIYAAFLNNGFYSKPVFTKLENEAEVVAEPLFTERAAFFVRDILSDDSARSLAFGVDGPLNFKYPVLSKTGTSSNHRDNWAFGVTPQYTIGVWAGNFDNEPMKGVSGVTGAAPLMHRIMNFLMQDKPNLWPPAPVDLKVTEICPLSGLQRGPYCPHGTSEWLPEDAIGETCNFHKKYAFDNRNGLLAGETCEAKYKTEKVLVKYPSVYEPWAREHGLFASLPGYSPLCPADVKEAIDEGGLKIEVPGEGDIYKIDPTIPIGYQTIYFKASGGTQNYVWTLNGEVLANSIGNLEWTLVKGRHHLLLSDGVNSINRTFEVK